MMNISQKTISTLGSCVTRDIFRLCDKDEKFILHGNVGFISPISMFSDGLQDDAIIEMINQCSVPNFSKRNAILDLTGNVWDYISSNKSEYLIMDFGDIWFPTLVKDNIRVTLRITEPEGEILKTELLKRGFTELSIADYSMESIIFCINKLCEKLLDEWDSEKIILIDSRPTSMFLDYNYQVGHNEYIDDLYLKMHPEIMTFVNQYAAQKLKCKYIKMPKMQYVMADANHSFGWHCLHYTNVIYEYFYREISSYLYNVEYSNDINVQIKNEYYKALSSADKSKEPILSRTQMNCISAKSLYEYLDSLKNLKNCLCILSIKDTAGHWITDLVQEKLFRLGLCEDLRKKYQVGYIAVIKDGVVIHEKIGSQNGCEFYNDQIDYLNVVVNSKPFLSGNNSSISINGVEYSANKRGLNFVIYDLNRKKVIDSVAFDTHEENHPCRRRHNYLEESDVLRLDIEALSKKVDVLMTKSYAEELSKSPNDEKKKEIIIEEPQKINCENRTIDTESFSTVKERQDYVRSQLLKRPIVILGAGETAQQFCSKYYEQLNIRCVLTNYDHEKELRLDNGKILKVEKYSKSLILSDDYIIVCRGDVQNYYKDAHVLLNTDSFAYITNFINFYMAQNLLDNKKILTIIGYCHLIAISQIFSKTKTIPNNYGIHLYSFLTDVSSSSYKYNDVIETVKLSDILICVSHFAQINASDVCYFDLLAKDAIEYKYPNLAFRGLHPYRDNNLRIFNKYLEPLFKGSGHAPRPFQYAEQVLDNLIEEGKSTEEICQLVLADDFLSEKEILRNFKVACKSIEINEQQSDLKISDYIYENYKKKPLYKDCLHYEICMYYEIARRIANKLELCEVDEINEVEKIFDIERLDISQTPVLPSVAKVLGIEYATDDYQYKLRLGDDRTYINCNREEWIKLYCDCMKAVKTLKDNKIL